MTYEQAKQRIFARGTIQDGYNGHWQTVDFTFNEENGKTLCITPTGYFTYHTPCAVDEQEALWLLNHHPSASNLKHVRVITHQVPLTDEDRRRRRMSIPGNQ